MDSIKNLIIAAIVAFLVGGFAASSVAVYHYSGKIDAINLAHELDVSNRINAGLTSSIVLATSQHETINRLEGEKSKVIGETNAQNQKLQKSFSDLRGSIVAGGLLRDKNADPIKPGTAGANVGTAGTAGADTAGVLSRQTSEELLDFARSAETTRLDLIRQHGFGDSCVRAYNDLVKKYNEATQPPK